jgi:diguanylate cyclase (GGDEF)-like protein
MTVLPLLDQQGRVTHHVGHHRDAGERLHIDPKLARDSLSGAHQPTAVAIRDDRLTGLFTLPYLEELLKRDWSVAQREKRSIAVFAIDIDALDLYNATFGRAAGDSTIRRVAHVVSGCLRRSSDVAARIDGGSLIAFAPGLTTEQALRIGQLMAERVRELRIHHPRSAVLRYISVSVGVCAAVPEPADSPASLLQKSQQQLQIAKKSGRNQAA